MQSEVSGKQIECVCGSITEQPDIEAIVNAANAELLPGGGVAGAIHRAAGPALVDECRRLAPLQPGEAVITGGHHLPNTHVIHCLGPVYGRDQPEAELLASCYRNALLLADQHGVRSIAFPAISTGIFRYPFPEDASRAEGGQTGSDGSSSAGEGRAVLEFLRAGERGEEIRNPTSEG
jgi:O-acetyl-ADP-ribose deacetylase